MVLVGFWSINTPLVRCTQVPCHICPPHDPLYWLCHCVVKWTHSVMATIRFFVADDLVDPRVLSHVINTACTPSSSSPPTPGALLLTRKTGVKVCLAISLFGCLFLSWIGFTLAGGSPYMLEKESVETKLAVSRSVFGGAAMYFVCACLAGFCWYRISFGPRVMPTLGHVSRVGSSSISSNLHFSSSVSLQ